MEPDEVTDGRGSGASKVDLQRPSLLPFDPRDLMAMRVRPADFARMCAVTRQTVSRWIKDGLVTLGPDGKLDPARASREVLSRADPARLRARVFKDATRTQAELRARITDLEQQLRAVEQAAAFRLCDQQAAQLAALSTEVIAALDSLIQARAAGEIEDVLDRMIGRLFYGEVSDG